MSTHGVMSIRRANSIKNHAFDVLSVRKALPIVIGIKARAPHGRLRTTLNVSAAKRDAENVPRLTEGRPRDDVQSCARVQDQLARRAACEESTEKTLSVVACRPATARACACLQLESVPSVSQG